MNQRTPSSTKRASPRSTSSRSTALRSTTASRSTESRSNSEAKSTRRDADSTRAPAKRLSGSKPTSKLGSKAASKPGSKAASNPASKAARRAEGKQAAKAGTSTGSKSSGIRKKTLGNQAETPQGRARNALLIDRQLDGDGPGVALILSASERKSLKAAAHHLNPVVMIGQEGLSEAVISETDRSLRAHELIKVRVAGDDRETRQAILEALCEALRCAAVQSIGKLLVLYRPKDYS
jgi:RNA-binding protein